MAVKGGFTMELKKHYDVAIIGGGIGGIMTAYRLTEKKPNLNVEFPLILCNSLIERNMKIVSEVIEFHNKGNPVLVIFQDFNEIKEVGNLLSFKGIKYYNVFDGRNKKLDLEIIAGEPSAVTLGTNICGRGKSIHIKEKPLHVIISYYTSNVRVMQQAYGRTGRKGTYGTVHIVCTKKQYYEPPEVVKDNNLNHILDDFALKNKLQIEFIESFRKNRESEYQLPFVSTDTSGVRAG